MDSPIGKRLLPALVDKHAQSDPDRLFAIIPNGAAVSDGFRRVSFRDLARGVDAMAWWIEGQFGKDGKKETVAYMAGNDIRYYLLILACAKTGYTPFLPSTRLSDEAYQHVLDATNCHRMVFSRETLRRTMEIKAFRPETTYVEVPSTTELLDAETKPYPFTKSYDEMEDVVSFIIHSSGTTGMPKPVPLTHGFFGAWDGVPYRIPQGRKSALYNDLEPGSLILTVTPNFHLMGLLAPIESIFHGLPLVSPPDVPLSVRLLTETIHATKPTLTTLPPSVLEEMSRSQAALDALSTVQYVVFGGAPLSPETGRLLRKYTRLRMLLGSSEIGIVESLEPEDEDHWHCFEWNPQCGIDMQPVGDGLYELVIVRRDDARQVQGIFHTFPDLNEYHMKDLFTRHPNNPNLWSYHGRLDDVIVLSNGEKLNPVSLEKIIEGHPLVSKALLVGEKRFQSALLIEPHWSEVVDLDEKELIDQIWPTIQRANETVPKYGRVMRSHVRLAAKDKPFKLTPKGTTQRRIVNKDYEPEIDAIYATASEEVDGLPALDLPSITHWLQGKIAALLDKPDITVSEDFYAAGLDSLQTVQLAKALTAAATTAAASNATVSVTQQQIYANPTVDKLASFLRTLLTGGEVSSTSRTETLSNLIAKYTRDLPPRTSSPPPLPATSTVILTGSTGSLGTYLLSTLLQDPSIRKVYCLNRSDAQSRQITSFTEKGLSSSALTDASRVEFLTVSFGTRHLGLDAEKYAQLKASVTLIIHNAWKVNFNHPVSSFEDPHLIGLRELINLSLVSTHRAHLTFVSSVSTIGAWNPDIMGPRVPETPLPSPDSVLPQGYGESKYIGERMCAAASEVSGIPTTVLRVGQIAGPTTEKGMWNPSEWLPILLRTSKALGKVPDSLGGSVIDWVPVDTLARIIVEICLGRLASSSSSSLDSRSCSDSNSNSNSTNSQSEVDSKPSESDSDSHAVYHLMNPHRTTWSSLLPTIQSHLSVRPVSLASWIDELAAMTNPTDEDVATKPALKLLPFFRGLESGEALTAEISVERARGVSPTMAAMEGVGGGLMGNWLRQWGF
ncbi:hypothetical protein BJX61DRAFT_550058 [Aspergillus egyptiacus]|nr:hypothetical protein BJX61DRAFT_550058 [Aspergillus egyptiacus]